MNWGPGNQMNMTSQKVSKYGLCLYVFVFWHGKVHQCLNISTVHSKFLTTWTHSYNAFIQARAVQDYDLYWIHIDHFKRIQLQYASSCILNNTITVECDTITIQYNTMPVYYKAPWHLIWDLQVHKPVLETLNIHLHIQNSTIYHVNIF